MFLRSRQFCTSYHVHAGRRQDNRELRRARLHARGENFLGKNTYVNSLMTMGMGVLFATDAMHYNNGSMPTARDVVLRAGLPIYCGSVRPIWRAR
jgi:hypothetical protein